MMIETVDDIAGLAASSGTRAAPKDREQRIGELVRGVEAAARNAGMSLRVSPDVIHERARLLGLPRGGRVSANGSCRMVRARDGWIAVNLPRRDDFDLIPAWLGAAPDGDCWGAIEAFARARCCDSLVRDAQLLGLAMARLGDCYRPPPLTTRRDNAGTTPKRIARVVDLSSLWAGPLCGALLAEAGADVVKVESRARPDGARFGDARMFARLNGNKRMLMLDLPGELDRLRELITAADVVIESARPRVWDNWGWTLPALFAANPRLVWVSITGYGRQGERANWVGFGDDVAAAAGLIETGEQGPRFVGDAVADPLAGLAAAAAAFAGLAAGGGFVIDASLYAAAAFVAGPR